MLSMGKCYLFVEGQEINQASTIEAKVLMVTKAI
jgi:hypothetical protein